MFMKEPHTALFLAPTGVGKTHLALDLLEKEYKNYFDFIIIICPTLNTTIHIKFEIGFGMTLRYLDRAW